MTTFHSEEDKTIGTLALLIYQQDNETCFQQVGGWWCSGILSGLLCSRSGVQIPDPPTLEKCAKGICLCNLLRSTQPNDRETVIEG